MTEYLFVYGTLKRGQRNHQLLKGWEYVGDVQTLDGYALYQPDGYGFPYMYVNSNSNVRGELYKSDMENPFKILDWLEGVEHKHYERVPIRLTTFGSGNKLYSNIAKTYIATYDTMREFKNNLNHNLLHHVTEKEGIYVW